MLPSRKSPWGKKKWGEIREGRAVFDTYFGSIMSSLFIFEEIEVILYGSRFKEA